MAQAVVLRQHDLDRVAAPLGLATEPEHDLAQPTRLSDRRALARDHHHEHRSPRSRARPGVSLSLIAPASPSTTVSAPGLRSRSRGRLAASPGSCRRLPRVRWRSGPVRGAGSITPGARCRGRLRRGVNASGPPLASSPAGVLMLRRVRAGASRRIGDDRVRWRGSRGTLAVGRGSAVRWFAAAGTVTPRLRRRSGTASTKCGHKPTPRARDLLWSGPRLRKARSGWPSLAANRRGSRLAIRRTEQLQGAARSPTTAASRPWRSAALAIEDGVCIGSAAI